MTQFRLEALKTAESSSSSSRAESTNSSQTSLQSLEKFDLDIWHHIAKSAGAPSFLDIAKVNWPLQSTLMKPGALKAALSAMGHHGVSQSDMNFKSLLGEYRAIKKMTEMLEHAVKGRGVLSLPEARKSEGSDVLHAEGYKFLAEKTRDYTKHVTDNGYSCLHQKKTFDMIDLRAQTPKWTFLRVADDTTLLHWSERHDRLLMRKADGCNLDTGARGQEIVYEVYRTKDGRSRPGERIAEPRLTFSAPNTWRLQVLADERTLNVFHVDRETQTIGFERIDYTQSALNRQMIVLPNSFSRGITEEQNFETSPNGRFVFLEENFATAQGLHIYDTRTASELPNVGAFAQAQNEKRAALSTATKTHVFFDTQDKHMLVKIGDHFYLWASDGEPEQAWSQAARVTMAAGRVLGVKVPQGEQFSFDALWERRGKRAGRPLAAGKHDLFDFSIHRDAKRGQPDDQPYLVTVQRGPKAFHPFALEF